MFDHLFHHAVGALHFSSAVIALLAGAGVLLYDKGTRLHVWTGRIYIAAMLSTNASTLAIYELLGRFGPFHVLALMSLLSVMAGLIPVLRKRPGWLQRHAQFVLGSFVGLCAAAVAEVGSHMLALSFGPTVIISSTLVIVGGVIWMRVWLAERFNSPTPRLHGVMRRTR
jgi:uncharacterized membrane protein